MLQTVSYPSELPQKWDTGAYPFYLELFGETQPLIDENYAEVLPAGSIDEIPQHVTSVPIYQYWWTIGHHTNVHTAESPLTHLFSHEQDDSATGITVSLYFPISGGWRIKELLPTIRDLKPFHEQLSGWQEMGKIWNEVSPLFTSLATLPMRTFNPLVNIPLALLPSFSKLHINTVQPSKDFAWSVDKVSCQSKDHGLLQGVTWNIPKKMFLKLGGRLTGSLAVSFIPSHVQHDVKDIYRKKAYEPRPISVQAVLNPSHEKTRYLPSPTDFLELYVEPILKKKTTTTIDPKASTEAEE